MLATSCILMYTLMIAIPSGSVYPVVKPIEKAPGLELNDLDTGTVVMFLVHVEMSSSVTLLMFHHSIGIRPGMFYLAASRPAIREATRILVLHDRFDRHHGRCTTVHNARYLFN